MVSSTRAATPETGPSSRDERRRQLLDAAVGAIRAEGPGVSMEQMAAAGAVTKPILYRHFGDRDGLVDSIGTTFATELVTRISGALEDSASDYDVVRGTIAAYLEFLETEPEVYRFLTSRLSRSADAGISALIEQIAAQVAAVIRARVQHSTVDPEVADAWAFGIVGMVHQAGDWWLRTRPLSRSALADHLAQLLWEGFTGLDPTAAGEDLA